MLDSPERILGLAAVVLGIIGTGTGLWLGLRRQAGHAHRGGQASRCAGDGARRQRRSLRHTSSHA